MNFQKTINRFKIVLSVGDESGIGPEITLKALCSNEIPENIDFILVGSKKNLQKTSRELTGLQVRNQQYEVEMAEYMDIFRRHNLSKLASAKPGMIETRANNKTKEAFDAIENDSARISALND